MQISITDICRVIRGAGLSESQAGKALSNKKAPMTIARGFWHWPRLGCLVCLLNGGWLQSDGARFVAC